MALSRIGMTRNLGGNRGNNQVREDESSVILVGTSITFCKLNLQSRFVNFLFKEGSHEDDKLTLKSPNKMMLERFRHKFYIAKENS